MIKLKPLTVFAIATFTFAGCGDDTTPANDESSDTGNDEDDSDDATATVSVTLTDPTADTTIDPTEADTTIDPTEADSSSSEGGSSSSGESSSGESSSTGGTGVSDCAQVTIDADFVVRGTDNRYQFSGPTLVGDDLLLDIVQFEFWDNAATGEFDLSIAPDDSYATCQRCIRLFQDNDGNVAGPQFFQSTGTMDIDPESTQLEGAFTATLTGVRLVEVEIDPNTLETVPVPDGACIDITDGTVGTAPPVVVPDEWTCLPFFYGVDDGCDCGCGVIDPDCADASVDSCDFCDNADSCSEGGGACPSNIDPIDNSVCVAGPVDPEVITAGPGLAVAIPDNTYTGALDSMGCVDLVAAGGGDVTGVELELAASHTWIGDLIIKVVSPEGTLVTVMSRPGTLEPTDDGVGGSLGDSSELAVAFPLSFADDGATDAENMGNTIPDAGVVCDDDGLCSYFPNAGAATPGDLSTFNGEAATGTWQLCIGDHAFGDTGTIDTITLTIAQE